MSYSSNYMTTKKNNTLSDWKQVSLLLFPILNMVNLDFEKNINFATENALTVLLEEQRLSLNNDMVILPLFI